MMYGLSSSKLGARVLHRLWSCLDSAVCKNVQFSRHVVCCITKFAERSIFLRCVHSLLVLGGSLFPVCVCTLLGTLVVHTGCRSLSQYWTGTLCQGYKINQHQHKGLEISAFFINTVGFVKFSVIQLDLCVCAVPFAGFALMAQCWLIPMSPVDITSDVITKPPQWGRLLNHCQRTFTHFYKWSSIFSRAFGIKYITETAFSRIARQSR